MTRVSLPSLAIVLLLPASFALAAEDCSMLRGTCRDACGPAEEAQQGAFEDCGDGQKCCVEADPAAAGTRCCIYSFAEKDFGPLNCGLPAGTACAKGAASPLACGKLKMCREQGGR